MRSERWTEKNEIKSILSASDNNHGGPILHVENGKKFCWDKENHIAIMGRTRSGKSSCGVFSLVKSHVDAGSSLICIDPKGEITDKVGPFAQKTHRVHTIDLRTPWQSSDRWNPYCTPSSLYKTGDKCKVDIASKLIDAVSKGLCPLDRNSDPYWNESAAQLITSLFHALLLMGEEYCNIPSLLAMLQQTENRMGGSFLLKEFYDLLPRDSIAYQQMSSYVSGATDTRKSTLTVTQRAVSPYILSKGILNLLSDDTVKIHEIDDKTPVFITIILPDEGSNLSGIAGLFIEQITTHLILMAQSRPKGKLDRKFVIVIEELGAVGGAIPNLANLAADSLGRNISLCLVLQDKSQLVHVYSEAISHAIWANIGIICAFSNNNFETLTELSQMVGMREIEYNGSVREEPLITPHQIGAFNTGVCLIIINNRYKWIEHLPFFDDLYGVCADKSKDASHDDAQLVICSPKLFDMEEYVKNKRQERISSMMKEREKNPPTPPKNTASDIDMDDLISKIDKKIAEIEQEEQRAKQELAKEKSKHVVRIEEMGTSKRAIETMFAASQHIYEIGVLKQITAKLPILLFFDTADEAEAACKYVNALPGAKAVCENKE